jgi:hypothetical protein
MLNYKKSRIEIQQLLNLTKIRKDGVQKRYNRSSLG